MAPSVFSASKKRPLEMVVYDADGAAAAANKRARDDDDEETSTSTSTSSTSPNAAACSLYLLAASAPPPFGDFLELEPISAVPPQLPPRPWTRPPSPVAGGREEPPPCLRRHFLPALGLRADLPVHFIDAKRLTATDLDPHQNRLRIPRDGAIHRLRPLLTTAELYDANLFYLPDPEPKRRKSAKQKKLQQPAAPEPQNENGASSSSSAGAAAETTKKIKKPKAKGKVHGGLRVKLVNLDAGAKDLLLSRWESSRGTIVKGEGYLDFVRDRCGFKAKDAVEVWAFVQRRFRIFGKDIFGDSLLHVLIVKKDGEQPQRCRYCRHTPAAPAVNVSPSIVSS